MIRRYLREMWLAQALWMSPSQAMQYASSKDLNQGALSTQSPVARLSPETSGRMNKKGLAPVISCHAILFGKRVRKGRSFAYRYPLCKTWTAEAIVRCLWALLAFTATNGRTFHFCN